ncbi:MAG: hypothetical protein K6T75_01230 [Acetobacteraceae bacterium]|nr:hypothetical protein [Acetobacteraceae bacterium]
MKEWQEAAEEVAAAPGVVVLVGATDTGKTTLAQFLANHCLARGRRVAVVDADVGQSDVGPPGTVGLSLLPSPIGRLSDAPLTAAYFVGSNSPEPLLLEAVVGARLMVDRALELGAEVVVVDTTGLVAGLLGRALKHSKIELIRPDYILAVERKREVEHLLRPYLGGERPRVRRLAVPPEVQRKAQPDRRQTREARFAEYFQPGRRWEVRLDEVRFVRSLLGSGFPMDPREVESLARDLECEVLHAERISEGVYVVTRGPYTHLALEQFRRRAGAGRLVAAEESRFINLLCGLMQPSGEFLGLGIVEELDFRGGRLRVFSPVPQPPPGPAPRLKVQLGLLRVSPGGQELGRLEPGEV